MATCVNSNVQTDTSQTVVNYVKKRHPIKINCVANKLLLLALTGEGSGTMKQLVYISSCPPLRRVSMTLVLWRATHADARKTSSMQRTRRRLFGGDTLAWNRTKQRRPVFIDTWYRRTVEVMHFVWRVQVCVSYFHSCGHWNIKWKKKKKHTHLKKKFSRQQLIAGLALLLLLRQCCT